ncbi:electron transfer flavoprotein subunit alpha/FixB family protein [Bartonella sp. DGB1]|uniref:electron transfer flavoprotein subunit alpha/FixB family protein n=1 Tax=Bartonella sp. DGB1 TaxID=3239807 RepID=UPI0035256A6C
MSLLLLAHHQNNKLSNQTLASLTAATKLSNKIDLLIVGHQILDIVAEARLYPHINQILTVDNESFANIMAEDLSDLLVTLIQENNYKYLISPTVSYAKFAFPRVAAKFDVAQISDVIAILDKDTFQRPSYAGNIIETIKSLNNLKILTIRATTFDKMQQIANHTTPIKEIKFETNNYLSKFIANETSHNKDIDLQSADIIISGGRGLESKENFTKLLQPLAVKLNAAIGASRAAVDLGYAPNEWQIGQTGKIVAPTLYIAVGISGAIQHIAGICDAQIIVAINKDKDAPIFEYADCGLVGDLFEILPKLQNKLA